MTFRMAIAATTATHPESVQGDPEEVGGEVLDPVDLVPPLPELQERILHQLLGILAVPGHEVEGFEEAFVILLEELVEAGPCFGSFRGESQDLTLRSHDPWMRGPPVSLTRMVASFPPRGQGDEPGVPDLAK
jgi:hypothetical protein